MNRHRRWTRIWGVFFNLALASAAASLPSTVTAAPEFSKGFLPDTIGPGSVTRLSFFIDNLDTEVSVPVTDLAFTDNLPAGVTIATPANVFTDCANAVIGAPAGGTTVSMAGGRLSAFSTCSVAVDVTSSVVGAHFNVSGDLTSSDGSTGPAEATLTVDAARPGFSKSFAPGSIPLGGTSTLTFSFDNSANAAPVGYLQFHDSLPADMVVAMPPNASSDCGSGPVVPSFTAIPGTGEIDFFVLGSLQGFPAVDAGETCTASVDVTTTTSGSFDNISGNLSYIFNQQAIAGFATAVLDVPIEFLNKVFLDDPVTPGGSVTLQFTINNPSRTDAATDIAFSDDLTFLNGLAASLPPNPDPPCGPGSSLSGVTLLSFAGGSLPPGGSCTFQVALDVPAAATPGTYTNTTTAVNATIGGAPVTGNMAVDELAIDLAPTFTKEYLTNPVGAGGTTTLRFTITNNSSTLSLSDIAFEDVFDDVTPTASVIPVNPVCNTGFSTYTPFFDGGQGSSNIPATFTVTGASLAASESCTIEITLDVVTNATEGVYPNSTTTITGLLDGTQPVEGFPASDDLVVVGGPSLTKEFTDDPVVAPGSVSLEFTLSHSEFAGGPATGIAFSDDLVFLNGLTAVGLPLTAACDPDGPGGNPGTGTLSGTTLLDFSAGSLAPGESCSFMVTLDVPATAGAGAHTNTTSDVTATVGGIAVTGNPASDDLRVGGLTLTKEFLDDPVLPGDTVTLEFVIENVSLTETATSITILDDMSTILGGSPDITGDGVTVVDVCGPGNGSVTWSSGDTFMTFSGGTLAPGENCSFSVVLNVPAAATSGTYVNSTGTGTGPGFTALMPTTVAFDEASDDLIINNELLLFTKEFTDDPVAPGGTVTLEFTLSNLDASDSATGIAFTDDLDAVLPGLVATGLPLDNVCGAGNGTLADLGNGLLGFSGATLAAGASCTFSVTLQVPVGATIGGTVTNTTSQATGTMNGLPVVGGPAIDQLMLGLGFSKAFAGPAAPGGTVTLNFVIQNPNSAAGVADISFSDDLDAVITGLTATGLPANNVCGAGSVLAGTSLLTMTGASLPPGGSCTIPVTLQIPPVVSSGSYVNATSELFLTQGLVAAAPALADLQIVSPAVEITKTPQLPQVIAGGTATFTILVRNLGDVDLTSLAVSDPLTPACNRAAGVLPSLVPGGSTSYNCDTAPLFADLTNVASVTADSVGGAVSDSATALVTIDLRQAAIQITKTAQAPQVTAGSAATFTIGLQNVGDVDLTNIAVSDPLSPNCTRAAGQLATLAPGGSTSYACDSAPLFADLTNVASVTANSVVGAASGSASALVTITPAVTCFTDATATGTGNATLCFTGGGPGCGFQTAANIALEGDPLSPPAGSSPPNLAYPHGLVTFSIGGACSPGFTADFTLTLPTAAPSGSVLSKYGPTTVNQIPHWYVLPATINGNVVSFSITDGGTGDSDLAADGAIVDPAGVAAPASAPAPGATRAIPALNQWGMLLLLLILTVAGFYAMRRGHNG